MENATVKTVLPLNVRMGLKSGGLMGNATVKTVLPSNMRMGLKSGGLMDKDIGKCSIVECTKKNWWI